MSRVSAGDVRSFLLMQYVGPLAAKGLSADDVPDDFDLHFEGIIDSLGVLEMVGEIESRFGLEIDFEELDAEELTLIGPLTRFVEHQSENSLPQPR